MSLVYLETSVKVRMELQCYFQVPDHSIRTQSSPFIIDLGPSLFFKLMRNLVWMHWVFFLRLLLISREAFPEYQSVWGRGVAQRAAGSAGPLGRPSPPRTRCWPEGLLRRQSPHPTSFLLPLCQAPSFLGE